MSAFYGVLLVLPVVIIAAAVVLAARQRSGRGSPTARSGGSPDRLA